MSFIANAFGAGGSGSGGAGTYVGPVTNDQASQSLESAQNSANQASYLGNQGMNYQLQNVAAQQALAAQLGQLAAGNGPNPALAQLNQTTGQNVANQAALMAGQRGAGANPGLLARDAAQQGAATQQQAVGQAATMRAQQQLAGINALQNQQQLQAGQANGMVNLGVDATRNIANTYLGGAQGNAQMENGEQQANAGNATKTVGGIINGAAAALAAAEGGEIVSIGKENYSGYPGKSKTLAHLYAAGGHVKQRVSALVSPGEEILSPEQARKAKGGMIEAIKGKVVPGKPVVGGAQNSYANDVVPAKLPVGSIVLPRSVTQAPNKEAAKKQFIESLKKKGK
jgi:hypothetical protein